MNDFILPHHGGNIYFFAERFGLLPSKIVDLSSSVNPMIKSFLDFEKDELLEALSRYPDPECLELKRLFAEKYSLSESFILVGNGSFELLQFLIFSLPSNTKIFLPEPTFIGYRKIISKRRNLIPHPHISLYPERHLETLQNFLENSPSPKAVIICNPNNPTGLSFNKESLLSFIWDYPDVFFIIDEAFIEFDEKNSLITEVSTYANLFILRSLTKFFGLAGARVGFLISSNPLLREVNALKPFWSVNTISQFFAIKILKNESFVRESLNYFSRLKSLFEERMKTLKVEFLPSKTNFYLLKNLPRGYNFFVWLIREKNILVRNCFNFLGLSENDIRVSLKEEGSLILFCEALEEWLRGL
ncbi:MAG: histidinol-phosphate transaminase [Caldimicrobium sp.]